MIIQKRNQSGFSLIEVLLAMATMTVGMVFIGGTFFVGVHFSTRSFEKGMGDLVAREAVNMIRLYGVDPGRPAYSDLKNGLAVNYRDVAVAGPSSNTYVYAHNRQYRWDAILQQEPESDGVGVTVFVSRWSGDEDNAPALQQLDVDFVDNVAGYFIDPSQVQGLYHDQWVVDGRDIRFKYRVIRSRTDSPAPGHWQLDWDSRQSQARALPDPAQIWTVVPASNGILGIQSRIVVVYKDIIPL